MSRTGERHAPNPLSVKKGLKGEKQRLYAED